MQGSHAFCWVEVAPLTYNLIHVHYAYEVKSHRPFFEELYLAKYPSQEASGVMWAVLKIYGLLLFIDYISAPNIWGTKMGPLFEMQLL